MTPGVKIKDVLDKGISIKLFKQSSISTLWNFLTISISSILTFLTVRFVYASGRSLFDERTGIIAMIFFTLSPYTYFYALSGGITIYVLFGTTLCTYTILKIFNKKYHVTDFSTTNL